MSADFNIFWSLENAFILQMQLYWVSWLVWLWTTFKIGKINELFDKLIYSNEYNFVQWNMHKFVTSTTVTHN